MKENSIIKLENNEKYVILDKVFLENQIYYFCSKTEPADKLLKNKIKFFIEKYDNDECYLAEVKNLGTIKKLIDIVRSLP